MAYRRVISKINFRRIILTSIIVAMLFFTGISCLTFVKADPAWWNNNWLYRKPITIDHTLVEEDLTDFPILISLETDPDLTAHAQPDGDDLVFTLDPFATQMVARLVVALADGTELDGMSIHVQGQGPG